MNNWISSLTHKGLSPSSIKNHQQNYQYIQAWAEEEHLNFHQLNYNEVMQYVNYLKQNNITSQTINNRLNTLNHYINYQVDQGEREYNPIKQLRVKDVQIPIKQTLSEAQMEELYQTFPQETQWQTKYKVVLSLYIYQGIDKTSLKALKTQDIQLERGSIHIPQTKRGNSRNLPLRPTQIMLFQKYLEQNYQTHQESETFIIGGITGVLDRLKAMLQEMNSNFLHMRQLRASAIVNWLKQYNLRETQYFAGHRSITSTEAYLMQDVEELKKTLGDFHPLNFN